MVAQFPAHKPINFASLTDSFIVSFSNYWNFDLECKHCKDKTAFHAWKVTGTFKKQVPGLSFPEKFNKSLFTR